MINTLIGTKKQMSQVFSGNSKTPVTWMQVGPCVVTQVKTEKSDGYNAVQIGFSTKSLKNITKPMKGHLKGATEGKKAPRFLKEVKVSDTEKLKVGDKVTLSDVFAVGDIVSVTGTTKGKGFAGVVKRWGFGGAAKSHGQSSRLRAPGSIGQGTTPGRVRKGKKMGGRMGGETVTIKNLAIVSVDEDKNQIAVSGNVPGSFGSLIKISLLKKNESPIVEENNTEEINNKAIESEEKSE